MNWNNHSDLEGSHAFLGASKYSWLNYDEKKLEDSYRAYKAKERGTELHALAANLIKNSICLERKRFTLNRYVNDAIGFKMDVEVLLWYSSFCFGTADAIKFDERDLFLRIHDLKTGKTTPSFHQLEIYVALFCLEYGYSPFDLSGIEIRLYYDDQVFIRSTHANFIKIKDNKTFISDLDPRTIVEIMDKIVTFDNKLYKLRSEYYA